MFALCALLGDDVGAGDGSLGDAPAARRCVDACSALPLHALLSRSRWVKKLRRRQTRPPPEKRAERHFKNAADYSSVRVADNASPPPSTCSRRARRRGDASRWVGVVLHAARSCALWQRCPRARWVAADDKATSGASPKLKHEVKPRIRQRMQHRVTGPPCSMLWDCGCCAHAHCTVRAESRARGRRIYPASIHPLQRTAVQLCIEAIYR